MIDKVSPKVRSAMMSRVKQRGTAPELKLRSLLHKAGKRFRLSHPKLPGRPDIMFPSQRKVIFVHGCFWHGHSCPGGKLPTSNVEFWSEKISTNRLRDETVCAKLHQLGWKSFVVWECELRDPDALSARLDEFLVKD